MKYCWTDKHEEELHGLFDSIDECKEDIISLDNSKEFWNKPSPDYEVRICEAKMVVPEEWINGLLDVEDILEKMDEFLNDNVCFEDSVFGIPYSRREMAQKALDVALVTWAREYVETSGEWLQGEVIVKTAFQELKDELDMMGKRKRT